MYKKSQDLSFIFLFALAMQIAMAQGTSQVSATIIGTVTDDSNAPAKGLTVLAQVAGNSASSFRAQTDDNGRFQLQVPPGKYLLLSKDEQEQFADCAVALFSCEVPLVDVGPTKPTATVALKTVRAARVRGIIKDQKTGKPIDSASVLLRRGDNYFGAIQLNVGPTFSIAIPANVDLTLSVASVKYRLWIFSAPQTNYATFRVPPAQVTNLDVDMVRVDP